MYRRTPRDELTVHAIQITVNGKKREFVGRPSAPEMLAHLGINPALVAVAVNGVVVRRADLPDTVLADGDRVEIVRAVGGG